MAQAIFFIMRGRRSWGILWIAGAAVCLCSCAGTRGSIKGEEASLNRQEAAAKAFQEGLAQFQKGRIRDAIEAWNRSLLLNPEDALAHQYIAKAIQQRDAQVIDMLREAEALAGQESWRAALNLYDGILEMVPGHAEAKRRQDQLQNELRVLYGKGLMDYQQQHFAEAVRAWEELLKKDPTYTGIQADLERARTSAKSRSQGSDLVKQYYQDGLTAAQKRKWGEAAAAWRKALELDAHHEGTVQALDRVVRQLLDEGRTWAQKNQFEKAIAVWKDALILDPARLEISQAIVKTQSIFEEQVNKPYQEGIQFYNRGNYLAAIQRWQKGLETDPTHEDMREFMVKATLGQGISYYREEKLEDAIRMWEHTLKIAPGDSKAALYLKRAKAKQKSLRELTGR